MYHKDTEIREKGRETAFPSKQKVKTGLQEREKSTGHMNAYNHHQQMKKY